VLAAPSQPAFFLRRRTFFIPPTARVNSLALLAAVLGLTLLERPTRQRVLLGSLALLAALFTKPTALDAWWPACLVVLLRQPRLVCFDRPHRWSRSGRTRRVLALTQGAFWLNVVAGNANPFDLGNSRST